MRNKKILVIAALILVAAVFYIFSASGALADTGWDDCPRGETLCEYPGNCSRYIDTNNDGICDHSQPAPSESDSGIAASEEETITDEIIDTSTAIVPVINEKVAYAMEMGETTGESVDTTIETEALKENVGSNANGKHRSGYYFIPVLIAVCVLYGLSYILSKKRVIKVVNHRRIWNVILLITTVISALLGLLLILEVDFGIFISLPFNMLFWHVEAGIAMGLVAVFHVFWHWRYFTKMLKP